jgi:hypothetical protein
MAIGQRHGKGGIQVGYFDSLGGGREHGAGKGGCERLGLSMEVLEDLIGPPSAN